jgi:hypothetical protein
VISRPAREQASGPLIDRKYGFVPGRSASPDQACMPMIQIARVVMIGSWLPL